MPDTNVPDSSEPAAPAAKPGRPALRWLLRLIGLGLVALVVITKVRGHDELTLVDGTIRKGSIEAVEDGFRLTEDHQTVFIATSEIKHEERGGRAVPAVGYGFHTLAHRLGGHVPTVVGLLLALAFLVVLTGWRWHLLVRAADLPMRLTSAIRLTFVGAFFNQAVPGSTGGDVVKAYYAAKLTNGPTRAVVSVFVDRFVGLFGLVLLAAGVLFLPPHLEGEAVPRQLVTVALGGVAIVGVLLGVRPLRRRLGISRLVRALPFQSVVEEAVTAVRLYRGSPRAIFIALTLSVINHAGMAAMVWGFGRALGLESLTLPTCLALVPVCNLMSAIPLLPGGWGVGEWAFAFFFGQVGVPATEAVGLSVIYRLSMLVVSLPGGLLWIAWRGRTSTDTIRQAVDQAVPAMDLEDALAPGPAPEESL